MSQQPRRDDGLLEAKPACLELQTSASVVKDLISVLKLNLDKVEQTASSAATANNDDAIKCAVDCARRLDSSLELSSEQLLDLGRTLDANGYADPLRYVRTAVDHGDNVGGYIDGDQQRTSDQVVKEEVPPIDGEDGQMENAVEPLPSSSIVMSGMVRTGVNDVNVDVEDDVEDIDDDEVDRINAEADEGDIAARMEELRVAMGVKQLKRRLARGCDDKVDHRPDKPSEGVTITIDNDKWNTRVVAVDPACTLRLAPRIRRRARKIAKEYLTGERGERGTPDPAPLSRLGRATHQFAKMAQDYFTGGASAAPNVFRFATKFRRRHSKSLLERFSVMARPYCDGVIEAILHYWKEFSELTEEQYEKAITLIINNGSKGPQHSIENAVKIQRRQNEGAKTNRKRPSSTSDSKSRPKRPRKK